MYVNMQSSQVHIINMRWFLNITFILQILYNRYVKNRLRETT